MSDPVIDLLDRGTVDVIVREELEAKLRSKKKLRVKLGIDPTGSVLHLGHSVVLRKMRQFQNLGHQVIFLIGDFTARIGDPTGRSIERPPLSDEDIKVNMTTYLDQAGTVLDMKKVEVRYNSEWLAKMTFKDVVFLASKVTFAQVAQRADFKERIAHDADLTLHEFMYPVMQGYDSVALKADVELGGTDQTFNLLMGRQIQKRYDQESQAIITCPILEGLDGVGKMSKSLNNYIGLRESPEEMYGKIMSIPDALMFRYFELATEVSMREIESMREAMARGGNPRDVKMRLARTLVELYHGREAVESAEHHFVSLFSEHRVPDDVPEKFFPTSKWGIVDLLHAAGLASTKSDARRLIEGGGVRLDSERVSAVELKVLLPKEGILIQVGKRRFLRAKPE